MTAAGAEAPLRVLLVDDQRLVRSGFALMLTGEAGIDVVGEAADGAEAIAQARRTRPDVVLMDVQMPGLDGIEATRALVREDLGRVLILTTFDRDDYLFAALGAGASGFLLKSTDPEHLIEAVRAVADGHALLAPEVTLRVIRRMTAGADPTANRPPDGRPAAPRSGAGTESGLERLTEREREVMVLVGRGLSNAEIATTLFLGEATVKTHVSNILAKTGCRDRVQAVVLAHTTGILPAAERAARADPTPG